MQANLTAFAPRQNAIDPKRFLAGVMVGLLAANIGTLYTIYTRWGIAKGMSSPDLTALRFGIAGVLTAPILISAARKNWGVSSPNGECGSPFHF